MPNALVGELGRCKSCGAEVRFLHTKNGRVAPFDPLPIDTGNVVFRNHGDGMDRSLDYAHVLNAEELRGDERPRFKSHFATCPHARQHSRPERVRQQQDRQRSLLDPPDEGPAEPVEVPPELERFVQAQRRAR